MIKLQSLCLVPLKLVRSVSSAAEHMDTIFCKPGFALKFCWLTDSSAAIDWSVSVYSWVVVWVSGLHWMPDVWLQEKHGARRVAGSPAEGDVTSEALLEGLLMMELTTSHLVLSKSSISVQNSKYQDVLHIQVFWPNYYTEDAKCAKPF